MSALDSAFELSVIISVVDRFSGTLGSFIKNMEKAHNINSSTMASIKKWATVGAGITAFGVAGAGAFIALADHAAKFQTGMVAIQQQMKLTTSQTSALANEIQRVGIPTIFNATQVQGIASSLANAGIPNTSTLQKLLPLYTDFADAQSQIKGENPNSAVASAMTMSHNYQLYSAKALQPFLQTLNAMTLHSNESVGEVGTAFKYLAPTTRAMNMSAPQTLSSIAFGQRMGLGSRAGTDLKDFFQHMIPGALGGSNSIAAMQTAGFVNASGQSDFTTSNGSFVGWTKSIEILQNFGKRFHEDANTMVPMLNAVFGQQGGLLALNLAKGGKAQSLYNMTTSQIQHTGSVQSIQGALNNTLAGQEKQFTSTMNDIALSFANNGLVAPLTSALKAVNALASKILIFTQDHPALDRLLGDFLGISSALALIIGPATMAVAGFKLMRAVWSGTWVVRAAKSLLGIGTSATATAAETTAANAEMSASTDALGADVVASSIAIEGAGDVMAGGFSVASVAAGVLDVAMAPVTIIMAAVAGLAALVYFAWRGNWLNIQGIVHGTVAFIADNWKNLLSLAMPVLILPMMIYDHWKQIEKWGTEALKWGENLVKSLASGILNGVHWLEGAVSTVGKFISSYLELHSPSERGPLSTLDQWFVPFVPTLMQGLSTGQARSAMERFTSQLKGGTTDLGISGGGGVQAAASQWGAVHMQVDVRFEAGSVVAPDAASAAQQTAALLKGKTAHEMGKQLQQLIRRSGTGVHPSVN